MSASKKITAAKKQTDAQRELLRWYRKNRRDLPWRHTRDPYRILVSVVMLQQTQVDRVLPFYQRFMEAFPDERALAGADDDTLHRLWKGLGYPSRAERLRATCLEIITHRAGKWPDTPEGLQELPGIGPYTAGAVACFAFARPVAVVDTNVARVYARRDGLLSADNPLDKKALWQQAADEVPVKSPIDYNNALMELGALVCTARTVHCDRCPWQQRCVSQGDEGALAQSANPLKVASKKKVYGTEIKDKKKRRQHIVLALIYNDDGQYLVGKRPLNVHMGGYWEMPGGKREKGETDRQALAREVSEELGAEVLSARPFVTFSYEYPDRYLTFHVYRCRLFDYEDLQPNACDELAWVTPQQFVELEFPPANACVAERMRDYHRLES